MTNKGMMRGAALGLMAGAALGMAMAPQKKAMKATAKKAVRAMEDIAENVTDPLGLCPTKKGPRRGRLFHVAAPTVLWYDRERMGVVR